MPEKFKEDGEVKQFFEYGFALLPAVLDSDTVRTVVDAIENARPHTAVHQRGGKTYAIRNILERVGEVRNLASTPAIRRLVEPILGREAFAARSLLFDKTPEANWRVPWHQDVTIAVQKRIDVMGFGPWSTKDGVLHVEAPAAVLERMLTVRIHLDDCNSGNGTLRVVPGSHKAGKLSDAQIEELRKAQHEVVCEVYRGGVMLMRPLLLHASSRATRPEHRRVIQLEFTADELPGGLKWA